MINESLLLANSSIPFYEIPDGAFYITYQKLRMIAVFSFAIGFMVCELINHLKKQKK